MRATLARGADDQAHLHHHLTAHHNATGAELDLDTPRRGTGRRICTVPGHPFRRSRFWVGSA